MREQRVDAETDVEAQVGGDLLVTAAAGMEFEAEVADGLRKAQLDEVVDVLGLGIEADFVGLAGEFFADRVQRIGDAGALAGREKARRLESECMDFAGGQLCIEQLIVETDGLLPEVEERIGCGAKASGPHLSGLFLGGVFGHESYSPFAAPLLSCGISEPRLRVMRPLWA